MDLVTGQPTEKGLGASRRRTRKGRRSKEGEGEEVRQAGNREKAGEEVSAIEKGRT